MACILIAEDALHIRNVLAMWLSRHGHAVVSTANGRAALEVLARQPVDLLITDVHMPEVSGVELANQAFEVSSSLRWVFVVTSSCDPRGVRAQLPTARVSTFAKPFSPSELLREVERVTQDTPPAEVEPPAPSAPAGATLPLGGER